MRTGMTPPGQLNCYFTAVLYNAPSEQKRYSPVLQHLLGSPTVNAEVDSLGLAQVQDLSKTAYSGDCLLV